MEIYNYVFHYNSFRKMWFAIPRDLYVSYWENPDSEGILKSKEFSILVELIEKGEDFINSIE